MYDIELAMNRTIDDERYERGRLVNQRFTDMNRDIRIKFSTFDKLLADLRSEFDSVVGDFKAVHPDKEVDELKKQLQRLEVSVQEADVYKPNVTFLFESDVTELLDDLKVKWPGKFKSYTSEFFFARGRCDY